MKPWAFGVTPSGNTFCYREQPVPAKWQIRLQFTEQGEAKAAYDSVPDEMVAASRNRHQTFVTVAEAIERDLVHKGHSLDKFVTQRIVEGKTWW